MSDTTGPLAVPAGTEGNHPHYPAGWVSPAEHERAERERVAQEITAELADEARSRLDAAIDARIAARRGAPDTGGPEVEPEPVAVKPEAKVKPQAGPPS
jgi:hypothetical protein